MTDREALLAECEAVCTSGCHADDCEHHGHIPAARSRPAGEGLREALLAIRDLTLDVPAAHGHPESYYFDQLRTAIGTAARALASSTTTEAEEGREDRTLYWPGEIVGWAGPDRRANDASPTR